MSEVNTSEGGALASSSVSAAPEIPTPNAVPDFKGTKHKVKVYDQELELDYDDLLKGYQQSAASQAKFREAAEKERRLSEFLERGKADPWELLQQLGIDADSEAEKRVLKKLERELMNPDARRAMEAEEKLSKLEAERKAREDAETQSRIEAMRGEVAREIDDEISEALREAGVKPTVRMIARMAEQMAAALDASEDGQRIHAKDALKRFNTDFRGEIGELLSSLPFEEALTLLPAEFVDGIRKHQLKTLTQNKPFGNKGPQTSTPTPTKKANRVTSTDALFKQLEKQYVG